MKGLKRTAPAALLRRVITVPVADADLVDRFVRRRDEGAFAALVERHGPMVLGVCRRVLGDRHAAEDAFQAAFLALVRNAGRVREPGAIAAWLYGVAVRIALKARRSAARSRATGRLVQSDPTGDPLAEIAARELVGLVDAELGRLPEKYRAVVVLCCLEGVAQDEAARQLGWSAGSVKGRLERGRELLRERLARRGVTLSAGLGSVLFADARAAVPPGLFARVVEFARSGPVPHVVAELATGVLPSGVPWTPATIALAVLVAIGFAAIGRGDAPPAQPPAEAPQPRPATSVTTNAPTDRFGDPLPAGAVLRLGTTRLRQPRVGSLAFTPDGALASFGGGYVVRVWDPATGRLLRERAFDKDRTDRQRNGWLSPDAQKLALQHDDRVKVFDVVSGRELASVALTNRFDAIARFSPDGKQLAVVDEGGKVQVCAIGANTSRELAKLGGSASLELTFSRDGRRLALANYSHGAIVWDLATDRELLRFKPAGLAPFSVDFDATGTVLAVLGAGPKQSFHFVDVSTGRAAEKWIAPPPGERNWARFAPDGTTLVLGDATGMNWFDPRTGKVTRSAAGTATVRPVFSTDGRLVASGGRNALSVWHAETGRSASPPSLGAAPADEAHGVAVSPDGKWIVTKDADTGTIRIWDQSGTQTGVIRSNRSGGRYPAFSTDGKHLYGTAPDSISLVRWNLPEGTESARYAFAEPASAQVAVLNSALSADGRRLAAVTQTVARAPGKAGESATFTVWDTGTGLRTETREADLRPFLSYGAFAPHLRWYAFDDRALSLVGGPELRLELPRGWFTRQAAVSPDGRFVAQAAEEQVQKLVDGRPWYSVESRGVLVHEVATGKRVATLPTGFCGPLAFTPDGRGLVVTDPEGIGRWDLVTQKPVVRYPAPGRFIGYYGNSFASSLAVTPDGAKAVTGHIDTTALVWDLTPPARRPRAMTEKEVLAAWDELVGADVGKAFTAAHALTDAGSDVVPFLRTRLRPAVAAPDALVQKLVAQLGAEDFAEREQAERELGALGDVAVPGLLTARKSGLEAEPARRVQALLAKANDSALPPGERLRTVRAVAVLEWIGTKDARDLLDRLATGLENSPLTGAAKQAAERLRRPRR